MTGLTGAAVRYGYGTSRVPGALAVVLVGDDDPAHTLGLVRPGDVGNLAVAAVQLVQHLVRLCAHMGIYMDAVHATRTSKRTKNTSKKQIDAISKLKHSYS